MIAASKKYTELAKVQRTVNSCQTERQRNVANKMLENWNKKHKENAWINVLSTKIIFRFEY